MVISDTPWSFTGRTTFVNTLCSKGVLTHKDSDDPTTAHVEEGVKIKPITVGKLTIAQCYCYTAFPGSNIAISQSSNWMRRELASL